MRDFIDWRPEFSVGNALLDEQHKRLFELTNQMWHCLKEPVDKKRQLFGQILEVLRTHFKDEERVLSQNKFPLLEEHRHAHKVLIKQLTKVLDSCVENGGKTWYNMMVFLTQELLLDHLLGADSKNRKFLHD